MTPTKYIAIVVHKEQADFPIMPTIAAFGFKYRIMEKRQEVIPATRTWTQQVSTASPTEFRPSKWFGNAP